MQQRNDALKIDLSHLAGFALVLDTEKYDVETGSLQFKRQARGHTDMAAVLMDPMQASSVTDLYWTYTLRSAAEFNPLFEQRNLTFGLVLLPPGKIGVEYIKTHGHYHSYMPGSQIGYPEVYTHYSGSLYLLMQRRASQQDTRLDDCVLYKMIPGQSIMIPPGYAHILINPSGEAGLMAGLYSRNSVHDYAPIDQMRGAAYYLTEQDGELAVLPNPAYPASPALREITQLDGSAFTPPDADHPLWKSFVTNPDRYAFLHDADAARLQFTTEDLRA